MDAEYFIEIILQGRDNLTSTLAKASAELKAFKSTAEGLSGSTDRLTVSQNKQAGASRNASQAAERAVISRNKEIGAIKDSIHTMHMLDNETQRLLSSHNALEKGMGRVRQGAHGVARAFFDLKRGVRDMDYATRIAQGTFFNFAYGAARGFDNAVKSVTSMNTVAALLAPLMFSLVTAALNLAAALVAVASAAAMAAAAIGGALVAGVMQAIPVVGLLAAAVGRLKAVLNASTLLQKEHVKSTRDFVGEQRKNARDLVDIQNAKIDAILGEKDANLALMEARERLRRQEQEAAAQQQNIGALRASVEDAQQNLDRARATGDPNAIASALAQMSSAQQQFNTAQQAAAATNSGLEMQRARLGVAEAQQRAREATITRQRAVEDANRAAKLGYVNKPQGMVGEDAANQALKALDPTERRLLTIIQKFKELWKKATRPLTDAILDAIGDAIQQFEKLFGDAKFMTAWKNLAKAIGDSIRELARFFTSREQREFFTNFIDLATKNLPTIVRIFERIFGLMERIGLAFAPVLGGILGGVSGFLGRQNARADAPAAAPAGFQQNALGGFASKSQGFLTQFTAFMGAFLHFIGAVIGVAAGPGGTALEQMTKAFQHWADELNGSKHKAAQDFFKRSVELSGQILDFFGKLIKLLFNLSQNSAFTTFLHDLETVGLPALAHVGGAYAVLFRAIAVAAGQPGLKQLAELFTFVVLASKIVPGAGFAFRQILRGLARGAAGLATRVGAGGIAGGISKALNPEVAAIETTAAEELAAKAAQTATLEGAILKGAIGGGLPGRGGRGGGFAGTTAAERERLARAEKLLAGESLVATTRFGRLRGALERLARRAGPLGGLLTTKLNPAVGNLALRLGMGAGLAGVVILGSLAVYKLIQRIPILNSAFDKLGRGIGNLIHNVGVHIGNLLGLNPKSIHGGHATESPAFQAGFQNVYNRIRRQHPKWSLSRVYQAAKDEFGGSFAQGGEVGGGGAGTAVPITAHVGEWVLNSGQQHTIASALGMPVGLIKDYLFGKSKGESMAEHARRKKRAGRMLAQVPGLKSGFDSDRMGSWFGFSPDVDDWGLDSEYSGAGSGKNAKNNAPIFIETPLGQYVNLARSNLQQMIRSKGFWIPEYVKRAQGYSGATRAQINAWKRGHVMRGLGINEGEGGQAAVSAIMRSKLWSYGSGGVVGFQPSSVSRPSFAAGGVVARGATPSARPATKNTSQEFNIITASPKVDIDYVMRIAKIHAESGS